MLGRVWEWTKRLRYWRLVLYVGGAAFLVWYLAIALPGWGSLTEGGA